MDFDEFVSEPGAFKALHALDKVESMTFRQFIQATGYWAELAGKVRDKLEAWNLITVAWKNKKTQEIRITSYGREVVAKLHEQLKVVERAIKAKKDSKKDP